MADGTHPVLQEAEGDLEGRHTARAVARRYLRRADREGVLADLRQLVNDYSPGAAEDVFTDHLLRKRENGGAPGPRNEGVVTLSDIEPEAVDWLWKPYVPLGKQTVLDGDPGVLKSSLLLDLAARLSVGRPMPDGTRPDVEGPAGTVLLTAEDGLGDTVRPRLDAAGGNPDRVAAIRHVPDVEGEPRIPHIEDTPELARAFEAVDARLLVVDPLMAFLPPDVNSNNDHNVRRAMAPLADLADEAGVAVVAIRHLNKGGGENPKYRGGGSIGILGAARSGLLLAEDPDAPETRRVMAVTKSNLAKPGPSLAFRPEQTRNGRVRIVWEGESDHSAHDLLDTLQGEERSARQEAADILREELRNGPRPVSELRDVADRLGVTWRTVQRAARAIDVEKNRVGGVGGDGRWVWSLPDDAPLSPNRVALGGSGGSGPRSGGDASYPDTGGVALEGGDVEIGALTRQDEALSRHPHVEIGDGPEEQGFSGDETPYPDSPHDEGPRRCACGTPIPEGENRCDGCKARLTEMYLALPDPDEVVQVGDEGPHMERRSA